MSFHFIVRFEPAPGREADFREALLRVMEPSRAEPGCVALHLFESVREPRIFAIHSEWVDEEAFNLHVELPHTVRFLETCRELLTHDVQGLRLQHLAGGSGPAASG